MKTVALLSGGLDSSTLVYWLKERGDDVIALSIGYGQKHARELLSASAVAAAANVPLHRFDMPMFATQLALGSSQTDPTIEPPAGHYADESMKVTVVPNRNMVLLSLAASLAVSLGADGVAFAAHGGDHAIYPDCRPEFVDAMYAALRVCDYQALTLAAPFLAYSKADIVSDGFALGVPFELTWSCYRAGLRHCGVCGTCQERREAFVLANVQDPTVYEQEG